MISCCVAAVIFGAITIGVGVGVLKPNVNAVHQWHPTHCVFTNVTASPYTCCVNGACQCTSNCNGGFADCNFLMSNLTAGSCCLGQGCYQRHCVTLCSRDVNRVGPIEEEPPLTKPPVTCRTSCTTVETASNQMCIVTCGTCYRITANYTFETSANINYNGSLIFNCGMNDQTCVNQYYDNDRVLCWYNTNSPTTPVLFVQPQLNHGYIAAIVIFGVFTIVSIIIACFIIVVMTKHPILTHTLEHELEEKTHTTVTLDKSQ